MIANTNKPIVSVIIPVYNVEQYMLDAITSLIKQTYKDFEAILVDDGSTDGSIEKVSGLIANDLRFRCIHIKNGGQSRARNIGINESRGQFIAFLDPDDSYEPDFLAHAMEQVEKDTDIVSYLFPTNNKSVGTGVVSKDNFITNMFNGIIGTVVWNKIFRKSIFQEKSFPEGEVHEEVKFFLNVLPKVRKCKIIDESLYNYRIVRQGNTNSTFNVNRIRVVDHQIDLIKWLQQEQYTNAYKIVTINILIFIKNYIVEINDEKSLMKYQKDAQKKFLRIYNNYMTKDIMKKYKKTCIVLTKCWLKLTVRRVTGKLDK